MSETPSVAGRRKLRIGIDATCLGSRRGYGRFLRELLPALLECDRHNEYVLFVDRHTAAEVEPLPARTVQPPTRASQVSAASARGRRSLRDLWTMRRAVAKERLDLFYFPSVYSYFPVPARVPVVVGIHDTIAERYGRTVFPTRRARWLWNVKVALARRQACALITVSEWSRRSIVEWFGVAPEDVFVTVEAPAAAFRPSDDPAPRRAWLRGRGLPEDAPYLLYVGGFNPHKNLARLVDAFADVVGSGGDGGESDLWLLLVGDTAGDVFHAELGSLRAAIARAGVERRVHFAGYVDDAQLRHLYCGALALVLPSLEEGFGLPAVEAAACGTPCVATNRSPLPDLLEGGGLFVDPGDAPALRSALVQLARDADLRRTLGRSALSRAGSLSWSATARATRRALEAAAAGET